jgi:hypothetical protein
VRIRQTPFLELLECPVARLENARPASEPRSVHNGQPTDMVHYLRALQALYADLRDPDTILQEAARTLDFSQPIALMLLGIMEHIVDSDKAYAIVSRLLDALPSGSYLALCDPTTEVRPEVMREAVRQWNNSATPPIKARSRQELIRFFDGLELLEPGVVSASLWRPEASTIGTPAEVFNFSGVGRKP